MKHSFHVSGKLMLSGEWSILTPGHSCITLPTYGTNVSIEPAAEIYVSCPAYGLQRHPRARLEQEQTAAAQFLATVFGEIVTLLGIEKHLPFHITLENDPRTYIVRDGSTHKLGIGSSACTVVGIVKALALFHGLELDTNTLFNIAMAAHSKAQENLGSGFDIAAAASGTAIMYTRAVEAKQSCMHSKPFDKLRVSAESPTTARPELVEGSSERPSKNNPSNSPNYLITPITIPADWHIAVGFSGTSASTKNLIKVFNKARDEQPNAVSAILEQIEQCVQELASAIKSNNLQAGMTLINRNQELLHQLSTLCNNALETPPLTEMIKKAAACGAAAKFSGAGGGDCVIALCPDEQTKINLNEAWSSGEFHLVNELLVKEIGFTEFASAI